MGGERRERMRRRGMRWKERESREGARPLELEPIQTWI